jgi:hypothetical protein
MSSPILRLARPVSRRRLDAKEACRAVALSLTEDFAATRVPNYTKPAPACQAPCRRRFRHNFAKATSDDRHQMRLPPALSQHEQPPLEGLFERDLPALVRQPDVVHVHAPLFD